MYRNQQIGNVMGELKWVKLSIDVFDNRKIKLIQAMPDGDALIVIWFKLLCLAGNVNDEGFIYLTKELPYTEEMLATIFEKPLNLIRLALSVFKQFGMLEIIDDLLCISNWEKYQNVDEMNKIREQNRLRKQKQRALEKQVQGELEDKTEECHVTECDMSRDVTQQNKNKNKNKNKKEEYIIPPNPPRGFEGEGNEENSDFLSSSSKPENWKLDAHQTAERFKELYNSICSPTLPAAHQIGVMDEITIQNILGSPAINWSWDKVEEVFRHIVNDCGFAKGQNSSGWRLTINTLLRGNGNEFFEIMNGKYSGGDKKAEAKNLMQYDNNEMWRQAAEECRANRHKGE